MTNVTRINPSVTKGMCNAVDEVVESFSGVAFGARTDSPTRRPSASQAGGPGVDDRPAWVREQLPIDQLLEQIQRLCEEEGANSYNEIRTDFCLLNLQLNYESYRATASRERPVVFYEEEWADPREYVAYMEDVSTLELHRRLLKIANQRRARPLPGKPEFYSKLAAHLGERLIQRS